MKAGIENLLTEDNTTITSSITPNVGFSVGNILTNDTYEKYGVTEGTVEVVIELDTAISLDFISLFNIAIEDNVIITTYSTYPTTVTNTKTINVTELNGLDSLNCFFELTDTTAIEAIKIETDGTTSSFNTLIGYIWAGNLINFGCNEAMQPSDESADSVTIANAGGADSKRKYNSREYSLTTDKEVTLDNLRSRCREVIRTGYGTPRPWWFDKERSFLGDEIVLGITDSGAFVYDNFYPGSDPTLAQTTIKIIEVL